ncbi:VWD domain-containing protein [Okeania sp. KiyG1]|uniref:VWD domain-containing protein n=1 Tax=Okeania sp. KiyG1 TaxID=2720165 RepID=UPI001924517F|nr:VWD domain-containing protein [Okeania sp. KiyG1]GGA43471.1 hypothetical protein CYANOKiyG1_62120 [Okeania sp. KiyG1]
MEGLFFKDEVSSLVSGDGYFGVGDVSGDIAAARLRQRLLPSDEFNSNLYPNLLDTLADNALPIVQDLLQNFSSKPDFKEQMKLAFGDSYDVSKADVLIGAWQDESLEFLPKIKIVSEGQINGANGAFAGETETIYLAEEFVSENLGNVEAIASVIVEEFGHYFDGEVNSFDTPGDEGEILANFVLGKELSADEFLRMKVEDDWAIGFLDGEMVSIEQNFVIEDSTLDFFARDVGVWNNGFDGNFEEAFGGDLNVPFNLNLPPGSPIGIVGLAGNLQASLGIIPFANIGNLGQASFDYPINISVEQSERNLGNGENFSLDIPFTVDNVSFSGSGLNLLNAGIDLEYGIGPINFDRFTVGNTPFGSLFEVDIPPVEFEGFQPDRASLVGIGLAPVGAEANFLDFFKASIQIPDIKQLTVQQPEVSLGELPVIEGKGQGNFASLQGDLDAAAATLFPQYRALNLAFEQANNAIRVERGGQIIAGQLNGLGFDLKIPGGREERKFLSLSLDLLNLTANLGLGIEQIFRLNNPNVDVTISVDSGEVDGSTTEVTKPLGESFSLTTPSSDTGVMEVTARYNLAGDLENQVDLITQGFFQADVLKGGLSYKFGNAIGTSGSLNFSPLFTDKFFESQGNLQTIVGPSESSPLITIPSFNIDEIGGQEDGTKNLEIERTYYIPYGMPVSISDASVTEGETLQFTVTLTEASDEPVSVNYSSEKGSGTVSFAPGETTQIIEILTPDDTTEEDTETFEISLNNPNGISFPENLPNGESTITATGTIFDNDEPPPNPDGSASSFGDPHLVTFDGLQYDFQAAGEFIAARSDSGDLEIQVRQRPFRDQPVSVNSALATKIGDQRIEFYAGESPPVRIDGQPREISNNNSIQLGEGRIFRRGDIYTVVYPTGDQMEVNTGRSFRGVELLNYNIFLNEDRTGTISGILGNNNGETNDDIALADGTVLERPSREELYGSYADSWRVTQENSLFDDEIGSLAVPGFPETDITVESLPDEEVARARELIGDRITDPALIDSTIIDLVLSGFDESFIEFAEQVSRTPETSIIIDIEPEAVPDTAITAINTPNVINVLANDISTQGVPLSLETFPETSAGGGTITRSDNGTPEDTTDDQLIYTPPINYSGTDTFQYTINDGDETASGIVTINIPGVNLGNFDNGFTVNGANQGSFSGASVSNIGDFNGDQIDDFIVGALGSAPNDSTAAGEAYVIFGTDNGLPSDLDLANLGNNGIVLQGIEFQGLLGSAVSEAGDVNNDGIDDLIIGAIGATANGNNNAGKAYIVFGNTQLPVIIDISQLNGFNGFIFEGIDEFDYAGLAVGGAGDINNDGIDDLFVTAPGPLSNPPSRSYIIYGSDTGFPATINASQFNGFNGFVITDSEGEAGSTVNNAGDVNNDGIPDLIIGADANFTDSYVIYGGFAYPGFVELSSTINGTNGFVLTGIDVQNSDGTTVQGVGDVNNDGIDDIMVAVSGTTIVDNLPITKGYVVFGNPSLPFQFDLSTLNGSNGFVINDFSIDDIVGFSIGEVGDFNLDGVDDILIGTSQADTNNINAGKGYVVFGKSDGLFPANIELSTLGSQNGLVFNGSEIDDLTGTSIDGAGDVNNDGVNDLIIGAPGSLFNDAPGKSHVVFGNSNFGSSTAFVFDEAYYLTQNPDIATSVANGAFRNGLDHFSEFGVEEERDFRVLLFNENYYLSQNPDVANLIANGEFQNALEQFTQVGQFEGRLPSPSEANSVSLRFDEDYYLNQNLDVNNLVKQGLFSSGFEHYLEIGQFEQRQIAA